MNKVFILVFMASLGFPTLAEDYRKFPDWAQSVLRQTDLKQAPEDAASWILLDDIELHMGRNGKLVVRRKLLRYVVRERGAESAAFYVVFGDENEIKVKSIKGWHYGRNRKVDKLSKKDIVTVGDLGGQSLSRSTTTLAYFDDVSKGSLIAFESVEEEDCFFPMRSFGVLGDEPIKQMNVRVSTDDPTMAPSLKTYGLDNWALGTQEQSTILNLKDLPAKKSERHTPDFMEAYPYIVVSFAGPKAQFMGAWDEMAKWYSDLFHQSAGSLGQGMPAASLDKVTTMVSHVTNNISYRQRYLSPGRGWLPARGEDVNRRAYGDCKDMVACLAYEGSQKQILVQPVLASIGDGFRPTEAFPPGPIFDHLIAGIALEKSLGLPAEVTVDGGIYLLVDPTSSHTEFGYLPTYYRGRQVMFCLKGKAIWIEVPESALEPEHLKLELLGVLNDVFTLTGSLSITEKGNAMGFRTVSREYNPRTLEGFIRRQLDLPGFLDMKNVSRQDLDTGEIQLIYQIRWPSFLMRDAGGLRLPYAIIGAPEKSLTKRGQAREMPIYFSANPQTQWHLQIRSVTPINPVRAEMSYQDESRRYLWKASGGTQLTIQYLQETKEIYFSKNEIAQGEAQWEAYRKEYNPFSLAGATMITQ